MITRFQGGPLDGEYITNSRSPRTIRSFADLFYDVGMSYLFGTVLTSRKADPAKIIPVVIVKCPAEIRLGTLRDHRFRVNRPLLVKREESEGQVVAAASELNEFGFGENFSDAVVDLQRAIVELYLTLKDDEDRLGPDLQKVWATLQERISAKL